MKAQHMLKPLAFTLAAILSTGAFAGGRDHHSPAPVSAATAEITDKQDIKNSTVTNISTENSAFAEDSVNGASGNIGVNIVAGDNNQQANAAALATADAAFMQGAAIASASIKQESSENTLNNYGTSNDSVLYKSANGSSGNLGVNMAAGNFNQQKNDLVVASSQKAYNATASANVKQELKDNVTNNEMSYANSNSGHHGHHTYTPVMNTADLTSSLNNASGNVGANLVAGGGNQQSNTLAIAAGCNACK
ncbi:MAG: hypothetical protein ACOH2I_05205 [Pseudomonas sp.]